VTIIRRTIKSININDFKPRTSSMTGTDSRGCVYQQLKQFPRFET